MKQKQANKSELFHLIKWMVIGLIVIGVIIRFIEKKEESSTDKCANLSTDPSLLREEYHKYNRLVDEADMLEKRTKILYKEGRITHSELQQAKDDRYNTSSHWIRIHDCLKQKGLIE